MKNRKSLPTISLITGLIGCALLPSTNALAIERVSAFDFGLSIRDFLGKTVTVEGCQFVQASITSVLCRIIVDDNDVGHFWIDSADIPRDELKSTILACGGLKLKAECKGDVSGLVADKFGELRITKATITRAR